MKMSVRRARREDREPIIRFVSKTWPWGDYVPRVWDDWYSDETGRLFVAVCDGEPVGMNHVRIFKEGLAWLEGVRVRPDMRRKGVATALGRHALKYAARRGMDIAGLLSASDNLKAHGQILRMGFKRKAQFAFYEMARRGVQDALTPPDPLEDVDAVRKEVSSSTEYKATGGRFALGWVVHSFSKYGWKRLVLEERRAHRAEFGEGRGIVIAGERVQGGERSVEVSFACGDKGAIAAALKGLGCGGKRNIEMYAMVPETRPLSEALKAAGFRKESDFIYFERRIAGPGPKKF